MKILVTGAKGFVGRNLCAALRSIRDGKDRTRPSLSIEEVFEYDLDTDPGLLAAYCREAGFVFNLAGVNRPREQAEFMRGNFGFASTLLDALRACGNRCPVMLSSSQQASLSGRFGDSEYGRSKKAGEELFLDYRRETGARVLVYRFPNLFGKWCRPNYNSAVATFCHNIARDLPIRVSDPAVELELLYVDDLVAEMLDALEGREHRCEFDGLEAVPADGGTYCHCPVTHRATLGGIVSLLRAFHDQPATLLMPEIPAGSFEKKLYSTYLSYLPAEKVAFPLKMNVDHRGSFTELLRTAGCGQFSVNVSRPGVTKGQHWHHTKWEFFIVVSGHALIQERRISPLPASPSRGGDEPYNTADPAFYGLLKENAQQMRKHPTEAESAMWEMLRGKGLEAKFRRQHVIGGYIVDFVCLERQLVVELDGGYHYDPGQLELDRQRTVFLQSRGFRVLRFTNAEVLANTDETLSVLRNALKHLPPRNGILPPEGGSGGGLFSFFTSGEKIEAVHMLPGHTHNIINLSDTQDLVTLMWANEPFDPSHPDTFFEEV